MTTPLSTGSKLGPHFFHQAFITADFFEGHGHCRIARDRPLHRLRDVSRSAGVVGGDSVAGGVFSSGSRVGIIGPGGGEGCAAGCGLGARRLPAGGGAAPISSSKKGRPPRQKERPVRKASGVCRRLRNIFSIGFWYNPISSQAKSDPGPTPPRPESTPFPTAQLQTVQS